MANAPPLRPITELSFETERLSVRHWQETLNDRNKQADLFQALENLLTPQVLVNLPPSLQLNNTPEAISNWTHARSQESECYLVESRTSGSILGLLILVEEARAASALTFHLGYLFAQNAWGLGYATELVAGLLDAAKDRAPLRFMGGVSKTNPASARVLQKLGFLMQPELSTEDTDMFTKVLIPEGS